VCAALFFFYRESILFQIYIINVAKKPRGVNSAMDYLDINTWEEQGQTSYLHELTFPEVTKTQKRIERNGCHTLVTTHSVRFTDHDAIETLIAFMPDVEEWVKEEWLNQEGLVRSIAIVEEIPEPIQVDPIGPVAREFSGSVHCTDKDEEPPMTALRLALQKAKTPKGAPRQKFSQRAGRTKRPGPRPLYVVKTTGQQQEDHSGEKSQRSNPADRSATRPNDHPKPHEIPRMSLGVVSVEISTTH
jgi:hypothetical protein